MIDTSSYEERVAVCIRQAGENTAELRAQLDAMTADELHALFTDAQHLAREARAVWLARTARPGD